MGWLRSTGQLYILSRARPYCPSGQTTFFRPTVPVSLPSHWEPPIAETSARKSKTLAIFMLQLHARATGCALGVMRTPPSPEIA